MSTGTATVTRTGLLVSVRSAEEVEAALAGGADLIDVKDPERGSLGKADDDVIAAVVRQVADRCPVSAAMGELTEWMEKADWPAICEGLSWVKFGLAGCRSRPEWQDRLRDLRRGVEASSSCRLVVAAYADWRRASAPATEEIVSYALIERSSALLIDTWGKDGSTLLEWMRMSDLLNICNHFRQAGIPIALSGALGRWQIRELRQAQPTWFAVRGNACSGSVRHGL
ncbi:MAG TPA: (5-formylfuran-3-yl)methyl phosphate synthase, partial [Gemmataceae bacterium]|nr:(5-formylfuran-3-yl)methyl phosphate synthase [Gemmataceae bacterium]